MRDWNDHHSMSRLQGRQQKSKGRKTWRKEKLNRNGKLRRFRTKDSAGTENFSNPRSQRLNEDGVQQNTASFKSLDSLDSFAWFVDGGLYNLSVPLRRNSLKEKRKAEEEQRVEERRKAEEDWNREFLECLQELFDANWKVLTFNHKTIFVNVLSHLVFEQIRVTTKR